ncbi:hypothetical protein CEXT_85321 [Caerostris extrusa]|uniref:Uncharacterized protein n=1 Tax=Caerostris extrusa TaxID=172846 RepID=A0AAV4MQU4_CAEEX|nr:hypothetical protein CEXT_85321 [Caerostris extrusa]
MIFEKKRVKTCTIDKFWAKHGFSIELIRWIGKQNGCIYECMIPFSSVRTRQLPFDNDQPYTAVHKIDKTIGGDYVEKKSMYGQAMSVRLKKIKAWILNCRALTRFKAPAQMCGIRANLYDPHQGDIFNSRGVFI